MQRMDYWHLKMLYVIVLLCQCPLSSGFLDYKLNKWALRGALPGTLSQHPGTAPRKFSGVKGDPTQGSTRAQSTRSSRTVLVPHPCTPMCPPSPARPHRAWQPPAPWPWPGSEPRPLRQGPVLGWHRHAAARPPRTPAPGGTAGDSG